MTDETTPIKRGSWLAALVCILILSCLLVLVAKNFRGGSHPGIYIGWHGRWSGIYYDKQFQCLCFVWSDRNRVGEIPFGIVIGKENRIQWPRKMVNGKWVK